MHHAPTPAQAAPPPPGARPGRAALRAAFGALDPAALSDPDGTDPVFRFETAISAAVGPDTARHVRTTASGSGALALALLATGGGSLAGRAVLVSALLPPYVRGIVEALGGTAIPVDAGWPNFTPTLADLSEAFRGLGPPHPVALLTGTGLGLAHDLSDCLTFAAQTGCLVIEDAAASLGAVDRLGHPAGTQGHFGVFSLAWGKSVSCGEGGVLVTHSVSLGCEIERLFPRPLPDAPVRSAVRGTVAGRLSGAAATLGVEALRTLDARLTARHRVARRIRDMWGRLPRNSEAPEVRIFDGPDATGTSLAAVRFGTAGAARDAAERADRVRLDFPALPCCVPVPTEGAQEGEPLGPGLAGTAVSPKAVDGHRRVRLLTWWDSGAASPAEVEALLPAVAYTLIGR